MYRYSRGSSTLILCFLVFFFFNDTATTEIYTLSLHDALPICPSASWGSSRRGTTHCGWPDRKSTRLNSSHVEISYAVFCLKKKKKTQKVLYIQKTKKSIEIKRHTNIIP